MKLTNILIKVGFPNDLLLRSTILLLLCLGSWYYGFGQTYSAKYLSLEVAGTSWIKIFYPGSTNDTYYYYETTIPENAPSYLHLQVRGADGGTYLRSKTSTAGGSGATIGAIFKIGPANGQIPRGSTLRFIIGERGGQKPKAFIGSIGMGGGGGTGIVFRKPASFSDPSWHVLLVGSGGGGAYGDCCAIRSSGIAGSIDINGTNGEHAKGTGGAGGENGESAPPYINKNAIEPEPKGVLFHGGGGVLNVGYSLFLPKTYDFPPNIAFQEELDPVGGKYVKSGAGEDVLGGYGFGGGGAGYGMGGGGGGYSGGGAGEGFCGGGGGGSYVNSDYAVPGEFTTKVKNGTTTAASDGYVNYQFVVGPIRLDKGFSYSINQSKTLLLHGPYVLSWHGDGNMVLRKSGQVVWASNTDGRGKSIHFQGSDGNLVIRDTNNNAIWSSATADAQQSGKGGTELQLTSDGRLSILNVDGKVLWSVGN